MARRVCRFEWAKREAARTKRHEAGCYLLSAQMDRNCEENHSPMRTTRGAANPQIRCFAAIRQEPSGIFLVQRL
jgi:hypothetical protein